MLTTLNSELTVTVAVKVIYSPFNISRRTRSIQNQQVKYCSTLKKVPPKVPAVRIKVKTRAALCFAALALTIRRRNYTILSATAAYWIEYRIKEKFRGLLSRVPCCSQYVMEKRGNFLEIWLFEILDTGVRCVLTNFLVPYLLNSFNPFNSGVPGESVKQ